MSYPQRLLVEFDFYFVPIFALSSSRAITPGSHLAFNDLSLDAEVDDSFKAIALDDLCASPGRLGAIKAFFALLTFVQLQQLTLGAFNRLIQLLLLARRPFEGTEGQNSFRPGGPIASAESRRSKNCDLEADADRFARLRPDDELRLALPGKELLDQDLALRFGELFETQQQPAAELLLERLPRCAISQLRQEASQSVVTEIKRVDTFAGQCLQQMQTLFRPFLNVRDAMVSAGKDAAQPTGNDLSRSQIANPIGVLRKIFIKEPDDFHHLRFQKISELSEAF